MYAIKVFCNLFHYLLVRMSFSSIYSFDVANIELFERNCLGTFCYFSNIDWISEHFRMCSIGKSLLEPPGDFD